MKSAIARAWGDEQAPPELRERVMQIAAETRAEPAPKELQTADADAAEVEGEPVPFARSASTPQPTLLRTRHPWFSLAAAAMLLLALGAAGFLVWRADLHGTSTYALSSTLTRELIIRHDLCCAAPDHHMSGLPRDNFIEIGKAISADLSRPVVSAPLPGIQWVFYGASICPVGQTKAAHLVFKDGPRDVSIFSLPASLASDLSSEAVFDAMRDRHPIAGFRNGEALICVVGSSSDSSLTLAQTRSLRDALMAETMADASAAGRRTTLVDGR